MRRRLYRDLVCILISALSGDVLWADQFNHKIILVGNKAAALGGAFAGLADDATACFHNPAGLTQIQNVKLSVSAQIIQYQQQEIQITPGEPLPYRSFGFSPTISAFSQRMGNWGAGFSIVTPQNDLFRGEQVIEGKYVSPGTAGPLYTHIKFRYYDITKTNLFGPSLAYSLNDRISVGITAYGVYSTQIENTSFGEWRANLLDQGESGFSDRARAYESALNRTASQTGLGWTGTAGFLMRFHKDFSLGLRVSPGGNIWIERKEDQRLEVIGNVRPVELADSIFVETQANIHSLDEKVRHVEVSSPAVALGLAWTLNPTVTVTAQVDYLLGSIYSYTSFTNQDNEEARSGFEIWTPVEQRHTIRKKDVVNFSCGVESRLRHGYSVSGGVFTDFAQGPYDSRQTSWNRRIDFYGGSLALGMDKPYTESRFGITGAWGNAAITHILIQRNAYGQYRIQEDENGTIWPRRSFHAFMAGVFMSTTLKI